MNSSGSDLPSFENPPVEETAFSIQFSPLLRLSVPYFGLYWKCIRDEYPNSEVQHPLNAEFEQFESASHRSPVSFQFMTEPEVRCWYIDKTKNRLIQIQRDRFVYNWRRIVGDETYPRYPNLNGALQKEWLRFLTFLENEEIGLPEINQCEVTYVNQIEFGLGWNGFAELDKVIAPWSGKGSGDFLPAPERVRIEAQYRLPEKLGRLHVSVVPAIRGRDSKELLQINLVARGAPVSSKIEDILDWFDLGREWVVKGFADITADNMHRIWSRTT